MAIIAKKRIKKVESKNDCNKKLIFLDPYFFLELLKTCSNFQANI